MSLGYPSSRNAFIGYFATLVPDPVRPFEDAITVLKPGKKSRTTTLELVWNTINSRLPPTTHRFFSPSTFTVADPSNSYVWPTIFQVVPLRTARGSATASVALPFAHGDCGSVGWTREPAPSRRSAPLIGRLYRAGQLWSLCRAGHSDRFGIPYRAHPPSSRTRSADIPITVSIPSRYALTKSRAAEDFSSSSSTFSVVPARQSRGLG